MHSRFYGGADDYTAEGAQAVDGAARQADDEMDSQLARFNTLEEYLEHPAMDIDERIKGVFGV